MSFWQHLFGGSDATPPAPLTTEIELLDGQLLVRVVRHHLTIDNKPAACYTYLTSGLAAKGQKEIVFTLLCEEGETACPRDPLSVFEQLFHLANQGRRVEAGDYTCFRAPEGFLGYVDHAGFIYIHSVPLPDVDIPAETLCAVLLTPEEAELVPVIGAYRVTVLLGRQAQHSPCPPWSVRRRGSVLTRDDMDTSVLRKLPLAVYPGASVCLELPAQAPQPGQSLLATVGAKVRLRMPLPQPEGFRDTIARMPAEWSLALMTWPSEEAQYRLVWRPGQEHPDTIGPDGAIPSHITGGFLLLASGKTRPTGAHILEDGFILNLSPAGDAQLRQALIDATNLQLAGEAPLFAFELEWIDTRSVAPPSQEAFRTHRIVMYQPDEMLRERVPSIEELSKYIEELTAASVAYWKDIEPAEGRAVLLAVALRPGGRSRFWVDTPVALEPVLIFPWLEALEQVPVPATEGQIAFAVEAALWKTEGKPPQWPFMPEQWATASANQAVMLPDGVLDVVWPQ